MNFDEHTTPGLTCSQQPAVAFAQNTRDEVRLVDGDGGIVGAIAAQPGMKQQSFVMQPVAVLPAPTFSVRLANTSSNGCGIQENVTHTLDQTSGPAIATFQQSSMKGKGTIGYDESGIAKPVKTQVDGQMIVSTMQVRRLTPVECERLQGFPDGYTNIPWRGKPESPDGPRYRALGNSWAVPNVRWIGERINKELRKCSN